MSDINGETDDFDIDTWPKEKRFTKESILAWVKFTLTVATVSAAIYLAFFIPLGGEYTSEGTVNLFPTEDGKTVEIAGEKMQLPGAKNYRLQAVISTKDGHSGFVTSYVPHYDLEGVRWPNGGSSWFDTCEFPDGEKTNNCETQNGTSYSVELVKSPKRP